MEQNDETLKFADSSTVELVSNSREPMRLSEKEGDILSDQAEFNQRHSDPSLSILELEAEPSAQFRDNYRIAAASNVGLVLKAGATAGAAAGAFVAIHQFTAGQLNMSSLIPAAVMLAVVLFFRMLFVVKMAIALAKTKYVLTEANSLTSTAFLPNCGTKSEYSIGKWGHKKTGEPMHSSRGPKFIKIHFEQCVKNTTN